MYNIVGRYKKHGLEGILYDKSNLQRITLQTNEMIEKEINQVRDIELECYKYVFSKSSFSCEKRDDVEFI